MWRRGSDNGDPDTHLFSTISSSRLRSACMRLSRSRDNSSRTKRLLSSSSDLASGEFLASTLALKAAYSLLKEQGGGSGERSGPGGGTAERAQRGNSEYFSGQPASFQWLGSRSWRCGPGGAPALAGAVGHCTHLLIFVSDDTLLVSAMSFGLAAMDTGESMVLAP